MLSSILVPKDFSLQATFNLDPNQVDPAIMVSGYAIPDPSTLADTVAQQYASFLIAAIKTHFLRHWKAYTLPLLALFILQFLFVLMSI